MAEAAGLVQGAPVDAAVPPAGAPTALQTTPSRSWPAVLALLGGALAMGLSPTLVRLTDVGPFASAFYRVGLALPVLYAWMRAEDAGRPARPGLSWIVWATAVSFAGDILVWHLAIGRTSVANATFFATTAPLWVVAFGWLIHRRLVGRAVLAGLGLCLLGGAALVGQSMEVQPGRLVGDALGELTAVFFGLYFLCVERARRSHGAARLTYLMSVISAGLLLVAALAATWFLHQPLLPGGWRGWAVLAALGLVSHAGGQGLLAVALGVLPAVFSSLVIFLEAIAAAVIAALVLGEPVTLPQMLGGLSILLGIWVARPRGAGSRAARS